MRPGRGKEGALQAEGSFPAGQSFDSSVAKKFYFAIMKKEELLSPNNLARVCGAWLDRDLGFSFLLSSPYP